MPRRPSIAYGLLIIGILAVAALILPRSYTDAALRIVGLVPQPSPSGEATVGGGRANAASDTPESLPAPAGDFDFWLLALSWSPSYCASEGDRADGRQCGPRGPDGFVVHGLWPQYDGGGYPEFCRSDEPERISRETYDLAGGTVPTIGLAGHQWRKHGTCSGLSQDDYFRTILAAFQRIRLPAGLGGGSMSPDAVEAAFARENAGLERRGMAVTCDRQYLREVRICMDKALRFTTCPAVDRRECRITSPLMPR